TTGPPFAWDNYHQEQWQTLVAQPQSDLELYNAGADRGTVNLFTPRGWRPKAVEYLTTEHSGQLALQMSIEQLPERQVMGLQYFCGQKMAERKSELGAFQKLVLQARTDNAAPVQVRVSLITTTGVAWFATVQVNGGWQPIEIDLSSLQPGAEVLLPRPYPGFQPLWFLPDQPDDFDLQQVEKVEIMIGPDYRPDMFNQAYNLEIESLRLVH
ncbi:MAG: membrane or secreted protein, partial [Saprospiraceae bacterium]